MELELDREGAPSDKHSVRAVALVRKLIHAFVQNSILQFTCGVGGVLLYLPNELICLHCHR